MAIALKGPDGRDGPGPLSEDPPLDRLTTLQDARTGLAIHSHRKLLGPFLVAAKRGFRLAFRPFLNEALRKQSLFNETLVSLLQAEHVALEGLKGRLGTGVGAAEEIGLLKANAPLHQEHFDEIPIELLFTEGAAFAPEKDPRAEWLAFRNRWADLPIARLRPHLALYDYFFQRGPYPQEYLEWHAGLHSSHGDSSLEQPADLLERRYREFRTMEQGMNGGSLPDLPRIQVEYNPRGYFNIRDGHHRAAFLLCRGQRRAPVRLSLGDRLSWAPLNKQQAVQQELERIPGRLLYTPILAPLFYERVSERDFAAPTRLETILRYLGPKRLENQRVLDIGSNIGFYAQHFAREGAIVTGVEPDPEHVRLAELLNELFGVRYQIRREPFQDCELPPHDVGIALTVFYHFTKDPAVRDRFLARLRSSVTTMLFWESGDDPEKEKQFLLQGTHFKRYQKLKDTYGTGKPRELGVFTCN